jgi:hypothetical protein
MFIGPLSYVVDATTQIVGSCIDSKICLTSENTCEARLLTYTEKLKSLIVSCVNYIDTVAGPVNAAVISGPDLAGL